MADVDIFDGGDVGDNYGSHPAIPATRIAGLGRPAGVRVRLFTGGTNRCWIGPQKTEDAKFQLLMTVHENLRLFDKLVDDSTSDEDVFNGFTESDVQDCINQAKCLREKMESVCLSNTSLSEKCSGASLTTVPSVSFANSNTFNQNPLSFRGKSIRGGYRVKRLVTAASHLKSTVWSGLKTSNISGVNRFPIRARFLRGRGGLVKNVSGRSGLRSSEGNLVTQETSETENTTQSPGGQSQNNIYGIGQWSKRGQQRYYSTRHQADGMSLAEINDNRIPEFEAPLIVDGKRQRRPNRKLLEKWETEDLCVAINRCDSSDILKQSTSEKQNKDKLESMPAPVYKRPYNRRLTEGFTKRQILKYCCVCHSDAFLGFHYGSSHTICRTCARYYLKRSKKMKPGTKLICEKDGTCEVFTGKTLGFCGACKFNKCAQYLNPKLNRSNNLQISSVDKAVSQAKGQCFSNKSPSIQTANHSASLNPRRPARESESYAKEWVPLSIKEFLSKVDSAESALFRDWNLQDEELKLQKVGSSNDNSSIEKAGKSDDAFKLIESLISESLAQNKEAAERVCNEEKDAEEVKENKLINTAENVEDSKDSEPSQTVSTPTELVKRKRGRPSTKLKSLEDHVSKLQSLEYSVTKLKSPVDSSKKLKSPTDCEKATPVKSDRMIAKKQREILISQLPDCIVSHLQNKKVPHRVRKNIIADKMDTSQSLKKADNLSNGKRKSEESSIASNNVELSKSTTASDSNNLKKVPEIVKPAFEAAASVRDDDTLDDEDETEDVPDISGVTRGPRIKHVCRRATVALGKPLAMFSQLKAERSGDDDSETEAVKQRVGSLSGSSSPGTSYVSKSYFSRISSQKSKGKSSLKRGRRMVRCRECEGCLRPDCGQCSQCRDMPKFGGKGLLKRACGRRLCLNMQPGQEPKQKSGKRRRTNGLSKDRSHYDDNNDSDSSSISSLASDISDVTSSSFSESDVEKIDDDEFWHEDGVKLDDSKTTSMSLRKRKMNPFTRYLAMARDTRETRHRTDAKEWEAVAMAKYDCSDSVSLNELGLLAH